MPTETKEVLHQDDFVRLLVEYSDMNNKPFGLVYMEVPEFNVIAHGPTEDAAKQALSAALDAVLATKSRDYIVVSTIRALQMARKRHHLEKDYRRKVDALLDTLQRQLEH